jgi:F420 biosynthesis protein FbiB-like protein
MDATDPLLHAIRTRRSIRRYRPDPVPHHLLQAIVTAAAWAPSAHNRQPWRFAVIEAAEVREGLARAMGVRLRADLTADGIPADAIERDAGRSYARLTGAPALIVFCLTMADMDTYPDARRQGNEVLMAVQSTAMAGQNALLAAHALGLAACWVCAPLFCQDVVIETLALPGDWQPQGLITVGYAAEGKEKTRAPIETRVLWK